MVVLRYAYVLALVVWLGGGLLLGAIVAPAIFGVLQVQAPVEGRALAGAVFGTILARFHWIAYGAGSVLLITLALSAVIGPRPVAFSRRLALIAVMLVASLYAGLRVGPRVDAIRAETRGLPSSLAPNDPRRIEFDRLHRLSTWLLMGTLAGGLVLLYWEAQES